MIHHRLVSAREASSEQVVWLTDKVLALSLHHSLVSAAPYAACWTPAVDTILMGSRDMESAAIKYKPPPPPPYSLDSVSTNQYV